MRTKLGLGIFLIVSSIFIATMLFLQPTAIVGDTEVMLTVAKTPEQKAIGLSNVRQMDPATGMLFIYDDEQVISIWMKDMYIPIDVVWLNKDQEVVYIVDNMSPDSYPTQYLNEKPAKYVLELNDVLIEREGVQIGDFIELNL